MEINRTKQKNDELDQLNREYRETFNNEEIVPGAGKVDSPIVIVGEAPGRDEVKQGLPFVGAAGKNLSEFISILCVGREELYITNAIKYRLGRLNPRTQRIVNRPATMQDIKDNQIWLHKEINLLNPEIIVTLGNVPLKAVTGDFGMSIGSMHGKLDKCSVLDTEYKLFPLYHPASIIYNRTLKEVYYQDMLTLKQEITKILK